MKWYKWYEKFFGVKKLAIKFQSRNAKNWRTCKVNNTIYYIEICIKKMHVKITFIWA